MKEINSGDPKLRHILSNGIDGNIVLIGFPYDIGSQRANQKLGEDNGPDCLRRFFGKLGPLINPELGIDITNLKISDYGNIEIQEENHSLEQLLEKLIVKTNLIREKGGFPIVIGGSRDASYANTFGMQQTVELGKKIGQMVIANKLDINSGDKIASDSVSRFLLKNNQLIIHQFGVNQNNLCEQEQQFINSNQDVIELTTYKQIQETQLQENQFQITKGGQLFCQQLEIFEQKVQDIILSVNLNSIKDVFCPGVSEPSKGNALDSEEIIEIMFEAGKHNKIQGLDIIGFNPSLEDYRTGRLLTNIIYYFILGFSQRQ